MTRMSIMMALCLITCVAFGQQSGIHASNPSDNSNQKRERKTVFWLKAGVNISRFSAVPGHEVAFMVGPNVGVFAKTKT